MSFDASFYLAQAFNIKEGLGYTHPSGLEVTHRTPMYPALLAGALTLLGDSVEAARTLGKLLAFINLLLVYGIATKMYGRSVGVVAAALGLGAPFALKGFTGHPIDTPLALFTLATILLLVHGVQRNSWPAFLVAGVFFGLTFLTKETGLVIAPLPLLLLLLWRADPAPGWVPRLIVFYGAFAATASWWWLHVYDLTGRIYLLGNPGLTAYTLLGAATLLSVIAALVLLLPVLRPWLNRTVRENRPAVLVTATIVLSAWTSLFLWDLEHKATPYPSNYLAATVNYLKDWQDVMELGPVAAIGLVAWLWIAYRALVGNKTDALLLASVLTYAAVFLFVANRDMQSRQLMVPAYLTLIAAANLVVFLVRKFLDSGQRLQGTRLLWYSAAAVVISGTAVLVTGRMITTIADSMASDHRFEKGNWNNQLVQQTAGWISANLAPGSRIMGSSLYHTQVYFLTEGRYPIYQLPTVSLLLDRGEQRGHLFRAVSTWTRFEDHNLEPLRGDEQWLFLTDHFRRSAGGGVYLGLSQQSLMEALQRFEIDYLMLTGEAGQSSLTYVDYFQRHPAFTRVYEEGPGPRFSIHIFQVNREKLGPTPWPVTMSGTTLTSLLEDAGKEPNLESGKAVVDALSANGIRLEPATTRERAYLSELLAE